MATNPLAGIGSVSYMQDPYQVKVDRQYLQQLGLWDPAWDAWVNYQAGGDDTSIAPAQPDFSSLNGYASANQDLGGGNHWQGVIGPDGQVAAGGHYFYDEPSMGRQFVQGAGMIGGAALGLNAAFGGLGGLGNAAGGIPLTGAEAGFGSWPAGMEGWGTLATGAGEAGGAAGAAGAAGGGIGTLGTIAPGAGLSAPLATMGPELGSWLPSVASLSGSGGGIGSVLGNIGNALSSANGLANLGSAAIGLYGQNRAIGAMNDATRQAQDFNRYAFDTIRADNAPLVGLRNSVLPQIHGLLANPGSITSDPGYQFGLNEGTKALANSAAGRGMTYSGAQGKALQRYGQDYAGTKLDQSLNRLTNVAGLGQVGSNSTNAATQQFGNNAAGNALNMGNARGSVYGNMANIAGNALSNIFNPWQYDQLNGRPG